MKSPATEKTAAVSVAQATQRDGPGRPLRVMHVVGGRKRSGVETIVLALAAGLRARGGEPIIVPLADGPFTEETRNRGFEVLALAKRHHLDFAAVRRLARLARDRRVDIVHSQAVNGAFYACPAGRLAGVAGQVNHVQAHTAESLIDFCRWRLPRVAAHRVHMWLTRWCDRLIAICPALRDDLLRHGVPPEKVVCIPNAIDPTGYRPDPARGSVVRGQLGLQADDIVIGSVSRLSRFKNLPMFLDVAKRLLETHRTLRFVIVGEGPERPRLERQAAELGLGSSVLFTGWRTDVADVMSAFDIFLVTSTTEGGPITALEAMALEKPIVATRVGVLGELHKHRELGLIVPSRDVGGMVAGVRWLLAEERRMQEVGRLGRRIVEREFTNEVMVDRVMRVYTQIMARPSRGDGGLAVEHGDNDEQGSGEQAITHPRLSD